MKVERDWINPLSDWSTDPEEVANTMTHGLGFLLSAVGAVAMAIWVLREGDGWRVLGCLIYAPSLVAVYAMSTWFPRWLCGGCSSEACATCSARSS